MKKLSIIIPVYNVQKYLRECLDSILVSDKNFEVLLIDDGSLDDSPKICDEYAKRDKRIKAYHKKNGGVSSARNMGISVAKGDYITFVDSDDILSKNWDEMIDFINNDDIYYYNSLIDEKLNKNKLLEYIVGCNNENVCVSGVYSKAFKRDFLIKNNIKFNENLINGEDMIYNVEAALLAKTFKKVEFHYYYYRQIIGQATRKFDSNILKSDILFHDNLNSILKKYNVNKNVFSNITKFCLTSAVLVILNRISYIDSFKNAKIHFSFLSCTPYKEIINDLGNNSFLFKLTRAKRYRFIYYYLKLKNRISIRLKYVKTGQFVRI